MTSISDAFNRADSTSLGADWTEDSGDFSIISNTLRQETAGSSYRKCRHNTALASDNYDSEVDGRASGSTFGFGAFGRGAVSATVTYYAIVGFGADAFYLVEITAGVEGVLASGGTCTANTAYNARINCNGSSLTGFVDDVSTLGPVTDTT